MYYICFLCLVSPHWDYRILMGFSASAGPHICTFSRSRIRTPFRAFIPPFVRSHTPPFLRIRTHHCPPHISCGLLTFVHPTSTFHALPVVCHRGLFVRIQALSNAQLNLRGSYALPRGHRTSERTLRFVCSPAALRHVIMHRKCPYWCACDGRCGQQGELVEGQRSACPSAKEWEAGLRPESWFFVVAVGGGGDVGSGGWWQAGRLSFVIGP